jgi:hypothetical protein
MRADVAQAIERIGGRYVSTKLLPATSVEVARVEAALGVALPPSYREFVSSIEPPHFPGLAWIGEILDASRAVGNLPTFLVAVLTTADGDQICFDTRHPAPDGEYPLVLFHHELHRAESTEFGPLGQTFPELLEALLLPPTHIK